MALIKCSECGKEISDKASCCPKCGCPVIVHRWRCSKCGNMISEEPCPHCGYTQQSDSTSMDSSQSDTDMVFGSESNTAAAKSSKSKKLWIAFGMIASILLVGVLLWVGLSYSGVLSSDKNDEPDIVDMGAIGNKITVDGTVAYVAGENKILVPYDFYGNYSECDSAAYSKSLKGCENPQLPTDETENLPEEVAREIIAFYEENADGFWTSIKAEHSNIEIAGYEPESMHYAGIMDNYFDVDADNVATTVYGYCLSATGDSTIMGLLVLYDVANEFEFTDVEDTADPNYSSEPTFYDDVIIDESEEPYDASYNEYNSDYDEDNYYDDDSSTNPLTEGKYTLSHIFSPFSGWIKVVDSYGNYNENWKSEELNRAKSYWESEDKDALIETDIQELTEEFEEIQPNMYIDVSDKWMRFYNIYNDFDLCKGVINESSVYEPYDTGYGHWVRYGDTDVSMGKYHILSAEIYEIVDDESVYDTSWGYDFLYYPDINGIGVYIDKCEVLFTL